MKCFYHSADLDGHCSGAIVKMVYPECEMIGINYGDDFSWESIQKDELVFMVDFHLQPFKDMDKLNNMCRFVWIDHHISEIEEAKKRGFLAGGAQVLKNGIGACYSVYEHLYPETEDGPPIFIKLLAEYDVWNHTDPRTLPFQYGMRMEKNTLPDNQEFWMSLFNISVVDSIIETGKTIIEYQDAENEKYIRARGFDTELDGLKCIAINKGLTNSKVFDSAWDPEKYDAMIAFCLINPERGWTVSLYTDKPEIDVSVIAKARGGGGHKQAAGFQCRELPFIR